MQASRACNPTLDFRPSPLFRRSHIFSRLQDGFVPASSSDPRHPLGVSASCAGSSTRADVFPTSSFSRSRLARTSLYRGRIPDQARSSLRSDDATVLRRASGRARSQTCCTRGRDRRALLNPQQSSFREQFFRVLPNIDTPLLACRLVSTSRFQPFRPNTFPTRTSTSDSTHTILA